jgi:hypothetical protein
VCPLRALTCIFSPPSECANSTTGQPRGSSWVARGGASAKACVRDMDMWPMMNSGTPNALQMAPTMALGTNGLAGGGNRVVRQSRGRWGTFPLETRGRSSGAAVRAAVRRERRWERQ